MPDTWIKVPPRIVTPQGIIVLGSNKYITPAEFQRKYLNPEAK